MRRLTSLLANSIHKLLLHKAARVSITSGIKSPANFRKNAAPRTAASSRGTTQLFLRCRSTCQHRFPFLHSLFFAFVSVALGGRVSLPLTLINMPCADLTGTSIATRRLRSLPLSLQCVSKRGNGGTVRKRSLLRLPFPTSTLLHLDHPRPSTLDSPTIAAIIKRNVSLRTSRRVESTSLCFQIILIHRLDIAVKHLRNVFQRFGSDCNSTSSLLTRISCCDQGDRDRSSSYTVMWTGANAFLTGYCGQ